MRVATLPTFDRLWSQPLVCILHLAYFTDRVIGQLKELRKSIAQRAIGHATCVLTHSKLYSGIFEMLESTRMVKVTAGDDAVKDCSVCNVNYSTDMCYCVHVHKLL